MDSLESGMSRESSPPPPPPPPLPLPRIRAPPSLEELSARSTADLLLPWILAATASNNTSREIMVFVHQGTDSITIIEGSGDVDSILRGVPEKEGFIPASKASIESLPVVKIAEPGSECPICLEEFEVNGEVKQLPCRHRFHSGCIDKWLGIHGSCPFCRYKMPEEEKKEEAASDEERGTAGDLRVHMFLMGGRVRGSNGGNQEPGHDISDPETGSDSGRDGDDMEIDL